MNVLKSLPYLFLTYLSTKNVGLYCPFTFSHGWYGHLLKVTVQYILEYVFNLFPIYALNVSACTSVLICCLWHSPLHLSAHVCMFLFCSIRSGYTVKTELVSEINKVIWIWIWMVLNKEWKKLKLNKKFDQASIIIQ